MLAICIPTYRRPAALKELLGSISATAEPACGWSAVVVLVADNDPAGSAGGVITELAGEAPFTLAYVREERPGVSHVRNTLLREARRCGASSVLFVDDDEVVSAEWIVAMCSTQERFHADFVCGSVRSVFREAPPQWVIDSRFFNRPSRTTGDQLLEFNTGNLLADLGYLSDFGDEPFDVSLSLTGSEDSELAGRCARRGAVMVWCEEGFVEEVIAPERCRLRYMLRRRMRTGSTSAYINVRSSTGRQSRISRGRWAFRAAAVAVVRVCQAAVVALTGEAGDAHRRVFSAAYHLGQAAGELGFMVPEYSRKPRRRG